MLDRREAFDNDFGQFLQLGPASITPQYAIVRYKNILLLDYDVTLLPSCAKIKKYENQILR